MKSIQVLVLYLIFASNLSAAVIDDLEDIGPDGTPVMTRVIEGVTVTITPSSGIHFVSRTYNSLPQGFLGDGGSNIPLNPANISLTRFVSPDTLDFNGVVPLTFEFDQPVSQFGLTTLDLLENATLSSSNVVLEAFDSQDNLVSELSLTGPQGPSGLDLDWLVSGDDIRKVIMSGSIAIGAGFGIDDLYLSPEPVAPVLISYTNTNWAPKEDEGFTFTFMVDFADPPYGATFSYRNPDVSSVWSTMDWTPAKGTAGVYPTEFNLPGTRETGQLEWLFSAAPDSGLSFELASGTFATGTWNIDEIQYVDPCELDQSSPLDGMLVNVECEVVYADSTQLVVTSDDDIIPIGWSSLPEGTLPLLAAGFVSIAPNPFNPRTEIRFNVSKESQVLLNIFNLQGALVKQLVNERFPGGKEYIQHWDGMDSQGRPQSSGTYFARLSIGSDLVQVQKLVLLK